MTAKDDDKPVSTGDELFRVHLIREAEELKRERLESGEEERLLQLHSPKVRCSFHSSQFSLL